MYVRDILKDKGGDVISLTAGQPVSAALSIMAEIIATEHNRTL